MMEAAPGAYLDDLRMDPRIRPETVTALRESYGLAKPLPQRYLAWLTNAVQGNLGVSIAYQTPAAQILIPRAINTLRLTTSALALAWALALPLGLLAAAQPNRPLDRLIRLAASLLLSLPELVTAALILLIAARSGHLPGAPAIILVLTLGLIPVLIPHIRDSLLETSRAPFVRAARSHGLHPTRIWLIHILPAAANPLISLLGLSIGGLLSASLIAESVIGWPGLGPLFLDAVSAHDFPLIAGTVLLSSLCLILGNLAADLLLPLCDPRIRLQ